VIPSRDLECGKSAIAANNQRQSRQQHAESQRGIRRHIPAGMTEEGPGAGPGVRKKHAPICFGFFSLSAEPSHPARLSSKAGCCKRVARRGAGMQRSLAGHGTAPLAPGTCWHRGWGQLCYPLPHLSRRPRDQNLGRGDLAPPTMCGCSLLAPTATRTVLRATATDLCARSHPCGSATIHRQVQQHRHVLLPPWLLALGKLLPHSVPRFLLQCNEKRHLCTPKTSMALPQKGSALGAGTYQCASRVPCRQGCWHTGAVVATSPASPLAGGARPLPTLLRGCSTAGHFAAPSLPSQGLLRALPDPLSASHNESKMEQWEGMLARPPVHCTVTGSTARRWLLHGVGQGMVMGQVCSGSERGPGVVGFSLAHCPGWDTFKAVAAPESPAHWCSPTAPLLLPVSTHPAREGRCGAEPEDRERTGVWREQESGWELSAPPSHKFTATSTSLVPVFIPPHQRPPPVHGAWWAEAPSEAQARDNCQSVRGALCHISRIASGRAAIRELKAFNCSLTLFFEAFIHPPRSVLIGDSRKASALLCLHQ